MNVRLGYSSPEQTVNGKGKTVLFPFKARLATLAGILACLPPLFGIARPTQPAQPAQPAQASHQKVLVLYWYNKDYSWNVSFDQSFQDTLQSSKSGRIDYYAEYLETDRFPSEKQAAALHDYLRRKYSDRHIDVLVATSDTSLEFLLKYRKDLFPNSPILFIATRRPPDELVESEDMTGIMNVNTYRETLDLALRLHPTTQSVYLISGTTEHDKRLETLARKELAAYEGRLHISYLTDRSPHDLESITRNLRTGSIVLFVWQQLVSEGKTMEAADVLASFAKSTSVPIYGMSNPAIGRGAIGGYINTAPLIGRRAAEMTLRIASGTQVRNIPIENAPSVPIFDWNELTRWRIRDNQLPPDSIIRFRSLSLWQQHKEYVITAVSVITLLAAVVGLLLVERRKRMNIEDARLRLATIVESSEDAIITLDLDARILTWNTGAERMYGYTAAAVLGRHISVIVPPEHMEILTGNLERLAKANRVEDFETVRVRKDGTRIDVSIGISFVRDARGQILASASIARDISRLKKAEGALRESEQELQRLTTSLLEMQDIERRRIAQELHDVTAQNVFATSLNLARLERAGTQMGQVEAGRLLAESRELCDQALQEIRTLSYLLHPPVLEQAGLAGALKWYVDGFSRRSGIEVDIRSIREIGRLPGEVETALFRVLQESLTNISRHSGSSTAMITLERQEDQVILQITDRGRGMSRLAACDTHGTSSPGVGIPGMRQRLRQFGGTLQIVSNESGTVVTASIPARSGVSDGSHFVGRRSQARA